MRTRIVIQEEKGIIGNLDRVIELSISMGKKMKEIQQQEIHVPLSLDHPILVLLMVGRITSVLSVNSSNKSKVLLQSALITTSCLYPTMSTAITVI